MFCLIGSLCYLEMAEESEECDKMFNEVDDGEWDISDDDANDLQSDGGKEKDRVTGNIKEIKRFHLSLLCFVDFHDLHANSMILYNMKKFKNWNLPFI